MVKMVNLCYMSFTTIKKILSPEFFVLFFTFYNVATRNCKITLLAHIIFLLDMSSFNSSTIPPGRSVDNIPFPPGNPQPAQVRGGGRLAPYQ